VRRARLLDAIATLMTGDEGPEPVARPVHQAAQVEGVALLEGDHRGSRPSILVAEDNPVNQRVAAVNLERRGYRVHLAGDGREALDVLARTPCAAVLMDCQMPAMDGYEATAEIRRREGSARHTPIIAMTAHSMKGDREKCLAAGMDDYLSKPLRPEALDGVLARWVPGAAAADGGLNGSGECVVDRAIIGELRSYHGRDALIELMELFIKDSRALVSKIGDAAKDNDASTLTEAAHSLKGSAATFGAARVAELCTQLETLDLAADPAGVSRCVEELEHVLERTLSVLDEEGSEGRA
jgi:CheY-like chemotaxis protein